MLSLQLPWTGQQQLDCKRTAAAALACDIAAARADSAAEFKACSSFSQGAWQRCQPEQPAFRGSNPDGFADSGKGPLFGLSFVSTISA